MSVQPVSAPGPQIRIRRTLVLAAGLIIAGAIAFGGLRQLSKRVPDPAPLQRIPKNAPFITTPDFVVDKMIELGEVTESDLVYDLGCGDGRIVITAARQHGCRGVGFDLNPERVAEAREKARQHGVEHLVTIEQQDVFQLDLSQANVIMIYLLPWMLEKLTAQFDRCPPGTRIVSHNYSIAGIESDKEVEVSEGRQDHYVIVYVTPLRRSAEQPKWRNWKDEK
jgi:SAM-dependent methyltransferase